MTPRVPNRAGCLLTTVSLPLVFLLLLTPWDSSAGEPFQGYPEGIRAHANRVVEAAGTGKAETLAVEVRSLRQLMFRHSVISLNALPDLVFERAAKEGWKQNASAAVRELAKVAPLSVPLWAWMIRDDLRRLDPERFAYDLSGMWDALRMYSPALLGYAAWVLLFGSAAACWFAAWASIALLLRARPALTADVSRLFRQFPNPEIPAALVVLSCFAAPVIAGVGLGVCAVFWIALSAGYLRRGELVIATTAVLLLGGVYLCGGILHSVSRFSGDSREGGWLGCEGYIPRSWPEAAGSSGHPLSMARWEEMVKFSRARAEMQGGSLESADRMWTEQILDGKEAAGAYNNRGIVRARLGRTQEALSDFEASAALSPTGGPAWWNAYQLHLQLFQLEQANRIHSVAWASIRNLSSLNFLAEEMTHGELVPSPLQAGDIWKSLFTLRGGWLRALEESSFYGRFFRPVPARWVLAFLAAGWLWAAVWKLLSLKVWLHSACRSCGTRTMVVGMRETTDICNSCRAQVGAGFRGGEERERRILNITHHRRYVRACSVIFPGSGALWAGKDLRAMIYGVILCLSLGALTVSLGVGSADRALVSDLQTLVSGAALAFVALLWAGGAWWGWRSFGALQLRYNVARERT